MSAGLASTFDELPAELKALTPPAIEGRLRIDPCLRPVFLLGLSGLNAGRAKQPAVGPLEQVSPDFVREFGGTDLLELNSGFRLMSPAVALRQLRLGRRVIPAVTDTASADTLIQGYSVAHGRQAFVPLPDGTWLGLKGSGQYKDDTCAPYFWAPNIYEGMKVLPRWQGLEMTSALEAMTEPYARIGPQGFRFGQLVAFRELYAVPDEEGDLEQVGLFEIDGEYHRAGLFFYRVLEIHRLVKHPQLLRVDKGLSRLSGQVGRALAATGAISSDDSFTAADLMLHNFREFGEQEAIKANHRVTKRTLHAQDLSYAGEEMDSDELYLAEHWIQGFDQRKAWATLFHDRGYENVELLRSVGIGVSGLNRKVATLHALIRSSHQLDADEASRLFPSPGENLVAMFDAYFGRLDPELLDLWRGSPKDPLHAVHCALSGTNLAVFHPQNREIRLGEEAGRAAEVKELVLSRAQAQQWTPTLALASGG